MSHVAAPPAHRPLDSAVHRALLLALIERGHCATPAEMAAALDVPEAQITDSLRRLEANHGVVPHPGTIEPWVVHPFSTTPTHFWVENPRRGWWSPCIWCALGVAVLVEGPVTIHTRLAGERDTCTIRYDGGRASPAGLLAHFPVPVARAWDNVHRHCACTLVFKDGAQIDAWCRRHGVARGEVITVEKTADLARAWYGGYLDPRWVKATAAEAAARFVSVGLTGAHWHVPGGTDRF